MEVPLWRHRMSECTHLVTPWPMRTQCPFPIEQSSLRDSHNLVAKHACRVRLRRLMHRLMHCEACALHWTYDPWYPPCHTTILYTILQFAAPRSTIHHTTSHRATPQLLRHYYSTLHHTTLCVHATKFSPVKVRMPSVRRLKMCPMLHPTVLHHHITCASDPDQSSRSQLICQACGALSEMCWCTTAYPVALTHCMDDCSHSSTAGDLPLLPYGCCCCSSGGGGAAAAAAAFSACVLQYSQLASTCSMRGLQRGNTDTSEPNSGKTTKSKKPGCVHVTICVCMCICVCVHVMAA